MNILKAQPPRKLKNVLPSQKISQLKRKSFKFYLSRNIGENGRNDKNQAVKNES